MNVLEAQTEKRQLLPEAKPLCLTACNAPVCSDPPGHGWGGGVVRGHGLFLK